MTEFVAVIIAFCIGVLLALGYVYIGMEIGLLVVPFIERYRCYFERNHRYFRKHTKNEDL